MAMPPGADDQMDPQDQGGDDQQGQLLELLHMAWQAGQQGMPFEEFVQKLSDQGAPPGGDENGDQGDQGPPPPDQDQDGM